ncbi:MAG: pteridine reductase [Gammaproteobacteria bacterium]|nr:MAG: pteridine reductase [Gammaproteobacteria bacterium]
MTDKVVLITGAARRIGAVLARALHGRGARVAIHYRGSADAARQLATELNGLRPDSALTFAADLGDLGAVAALPAAVIEAFGRLDVLVNNASTFYPTPVGEITAAQFDDLIGTNLRAPLFLAQAAAAELRLRHGLIINIADIHGLRPLKRHPVYSAAKAGLVMLTRALARELGPQVRVNAIAPGPVLWPAGGIDSELQKRIVARTALKRGGSPDDIARAVIFFATEAPFVTGEVLAIDGGRSLGGGL